MARYMERLENLARLIDVTQTFESPGLENEAWDALVRIHADETHFAKTYGAAGPGHGEALLPARHRRTRIPSAARSRARG